MKIVRMIVTSVVEVELTDEEFETLVYDENGDYTDKLYDMLWDTYEEDKYEVLETQVNI